MATTTYEVKSSLALVQSSTSIFASTIGILTKGTRIEVISITNQWAYFRYNENNAYTRASNLKLVTTPVPVPTGTITINYINTDTKESIKLSDTYTKLALGDYTYTASTISKYAIIGDNTKTVTLTESNPNATVVFEYKKILGSISIKYIYVDENNNEVNVKPPVKYENLELDTYTYHALAADGYTVSGDSSITVILTESDNNRSIIFKYSKITYKIAISYIHIATRKEIAPSELYTDIMADKTYTFDAKYIDGYTVVGDKSKTITVDRGVVVQNVVFEYILDDPNKINQVPYISTYYIKPVVSLDKEVIIDYYITDYFHKEYVNEDFSETFTVTVRIDGKEDIVIPNLKAGDHSISLGKFNKEGEQKFSILCTDQVGRNSHELFNFFLVQNPIIAKEYVMTTQDLATYSISNTNDTAKLTSTREGLQKLLDDKQSQGFNRLKLLPGTYRIDHLAPIYIPTKFTLDMNGSTLKLHEFAGDKAVMMELNNTFDSHVINGTIEGDFYNHDYANSSNNSEWVLGISIGGESKYSSYENLTIKDITGYGTINGIKNSRDNKLGYTYLSPRGIGNTFKLGDIDRNTGLDIPSTNRTTCDFRDISGYSDIGYLSVSVYLGYQGNPCGTWNIICHFYDANKNFIKSTDAYQYRRVAVPSNAKFMRVTILNEAYPTNLSIQLFRLPTNCSFKNLYLENCRAVGMAPQGMNNMLFENCELTKCGTAVTKCALDAEDGWDMMQDVTFRKLNFHDNPYNEFLTCAGHNFIIEDMVAGNIYIWSRTRSYIIRNSDFGTAAIGYDSLLKTGYYRLLNNKSLAITARENATTDNFIIRNSQLTGFTNATAYNCKITVGVTSNAIVYNCQFINFNSYINTNISIYNSTFTVTENNSTQLKFNQANGLKTFTNCIFTGPTVLAGNYCNSGIFNNCKFDNINISVNTANQLGDLQFNNCELTYYEKKESIDSGFIKYTNNASATFDTCKIVCIPNQNKDKIALVWIRNYVSGSKTIFKNCTITKSTGYVIDGYYAASTFKPDTSYEVILDNSPVSIQLISDKYKDYAYYKVTIVN